MIVRLQRSVVRAAREGQGFACDERAIREANMTVAPGAHDAESAVDCMRLQPSVRVRLIPAIRPAPQTARRAGILQSFE